MRIACVGTGWYPQEPGGLEKYVYGMTHALLNAGDSVDLFVSGTPALEREGGRARSIGRPGDSLPARMLSARTAFAESLRGPYDVLNIHFAMNALPLIPFIKHDMPRVIHFHGPWAEESRAEGGGTFSVAIKTMLERFVYLRADRFVVLSTAFKEKLCGYGVDAARVSVIPMGIDTDFFHPASERPHSSGDPHGRTVFFTARRLVNRVGLHELLAAAELLRKTYRNFVVKIAGKGPLRAELEQSIAKRELTDCVELLGFVSEDDLVRAYNGAHVTILPSQKLEGFGTIISESLACGTPVIVTPIGGMPEAVAGMGADVVCSSASAADIAERMGAVLSGTLVLPDAVTCRAYAVEHFEWRNVVQRVRAVFAPS
jgi:glycosyltransferase involved in cell wall biosynthesis